MAQKVYAKNLAGNDTRLQVFNAEGELTDEEVTLPGDIFDVPLNIPLIHQVVEAQRAAARAGTHSTKTRGEVSGGGKKPWRQKGTGRARHGSIRSPQWKGGGVAHGPKPRNYSQRTPKKMKAAALRSALSDRARNGRLYVAEGVIAGDTPSTRLAIETIQKVTDSKRVLIVHDRYEDGAIVLEKSYANAPGVHTLWVDQLNTLDVIDAESVVFTLVALNAYVESVNARKQKNAKLAAPVEPITSEAKAEGEMRQDKTTETVAEDRVGTDRDPARAETEKAEETK